MFFNIFFLARNFSRVNFFKSFGISLFQNDGKQVDTRLFDFSGIMIGEMVKF